jgi:enoyl-CoA hydratase
MGYQNIIVEKKGRVGLITLNRPKALNALCDALVQELGKALDEFESDAHVGAIVITGSEKAFAAGADIKEMKDRNFVDVYVSDFITKGWERVAQCRKPVIAAVAGYALGGGCELAMMCDVILAAENAKFGQPEITLGVLPGAGGTQRLTRLVGRAMALELLTSARQVNAEEAHAIGLANHVYPAAELLDRGLEMARSIAANGPIAVRIAKQCAQRGADLDLGNACVLETNSFALTFATADQKEGMAAFVGKRAAKFTGR